ncbi:hypothetical protein CPAR01_11666 [Colletotrichum paranaense]|uniref:Uncharacterized protein n=1 Tax=Colletotrichum paranaense TaxID=1914294 RepID=A0ABQ9SCE9_9PEZI|nr:uncharacterized protein CPAR01_11666 [Colletotrichum paranaense]KAK1532017.1 hypothetical protein CPAR01_11666 [Colletotrichum paranaense]
MLPIVRTDGLSDGEMTNVYCKLNPESMARNPVPPYFRPIPHPWAPESITHHTENVNVVLKVCFEMGA